MRPRYRAANGSSIASGRRFRELLSDAAAPGLSLLARPVDTSFIGNNFCQLGAGKKTGFDLLVQRYALMYEAATFFA